MMPVSVEVYELRRQGFQVRTRAEWKTRFEPLYQDRRSSKPVKLPVLYAFAHITVTHDSGTLTGDFDTDMRTLERIGYERFRTGISYTWVVDAITGMIGQGHELDAAGAHTVNDKNIAGFPRNLNYWGHSIAMLGMPGVKPTQKFINSVAAILRVEQNFDVMRLNAPMYPHSYFAYKECPTDAYRNLITTIRNLAGTPAREEDDVDALSVVGTDKDGTPMYMGEFSARVNNFVGGPTGEAPIYGLLKSIDDKLGQILAKLD